MKCHPEISVRAIKKFGRACTPVSAEDIASFYDIAGDTYKYGYNYGYNFLKSPDRIFNCDETAMEFAIFKFVCTKKD